MTVPSVDELVLAIFTKRERLGGGRVFLADITREFVALKETFPLRRWKRALRAVIETLQGEGKIKAGTDFYSSNEGRVFFVWSHSDSAEACLRAACFRQRRTLRTRPPPREVPGGHAASDCDAEFCLSVSDVDTDLVDARALLVFSDSLDAFGL